jgi:hypothetical protein
MRAVNQAAMRARVQASCCAAKAVAVTGRLTAQAGCIGQRFRRRQQGVVGGHQQQPSPLLQRLQQLCGSRPPADEE